MPRNAAVQVENSFRGGFITEASGLNFPENACTYTTNCVFGFDGSVQRRLGYEFEVSHSTKTISRTGSVVASYVWKNVTGDGDLTLLVKQVGATLYFYITESDTISDGVLATTINLNSFKATGAPSVIDKECQFSDGNGFLFVTHPYCAPIKVSYDTDNNTVTGEAVVLKIRDFEGVDDGLEVDRRPPGLNDHDDIEPKHKYNLLNQGWTDELLQAWFDKLAASEGTPSNSDVPYIYKDVNDKFNPSPGDSNRITKTMVRGNTPATKGHFILTVWDQKRSEQGPVRGLPALASQVDTDSSYQRPSTSAFFSGRVFWAGINYAGFNSKIYFSQIVEQDDQYGFCHQVNDPTSEESFELLPADGGVISLPEAGTIYKLFTITGGVAVFAANGIWLISGSTGIGFTAKDFTVSKISSIGAISATSFVDVGGFPAWWNAEGIYLLTSDGANPKIESLTDQRIKKYYNEIPLASKVKARGAFNLTTGEAQWIFRTTAAADINEAVCYDAALNFNLLTSAFYPWTIPTHAVKIHDVTVLPSSVTSLPTFKYTVSYASGSSSAFTFAEARLTTYKDWVTYDSTGTNYNSEFISGYKLHGQAIRKFQSNYIRFYSRNEVPTTYIVQGIWDFANTGSSTSRWSAQQVVTHDNSLFDTMSKRLKIRGHGLALQIRVRSVVGEPFDILGWSMFETGNEAP